MGDNGFDAAPPRYGSGEREVIDLIRDALGDEAFKGFCWGNAVKYRLRAGAKGDLEGDQEKDRWYTEMFWHVQDPSRYKDPRHRRPYFTPYERPEGIPSAILYLMPPGL